MTVYNVADYANITAREHIRALNRNPTPAQREIARLSKSYLEQAFATQIKQLGLPEPEREVKLSKVDGYRWDFVWHRYRLAVEVNGGVWIVGGHSTSGGIIRDMTKLRIATLAGYRSFQFHGDAIEDGSAVQFVEQFILGYEAMLGDECAAWQGRQT